MNLLQKIKDLHSGSRGLEQSIERNMLQLHSAPEDVEHNVHMLNEDLLSAEDQIDLANYLLVKIVRELRELNRQADQLRKSELLPVVELNTKVEQEAVEHIKKLLTDQYYEIVALLKRTEDRIALLKQTIEIQSKRIREQAPA